MPVAMPRRLLAIVAAILTLAVPRMAGQSFEVVSIKPSRIPNGPPSALERKLYGTAYRPFNGWLRLTGAPLIALLQSTYDVEEFQIRGAPSWAITDRFDIEAVAGNATVQETRAMLRAMLEERFALRVRREPAVMDIYELTAVRGGSKLQPTKDGDCVTLSPDPAVPRPPFGTFICGGFRRQIVSGSPDRLDRIQAAGVELSALVNELQAEVGRRIVDRTGVTGTFTVTLEFAPNLAAFDTGPVIAQPSATVTPGLSIFTALQEQLGLRLVSARGPVDVLVVERVERPTPN
jgi:uncharacterized protein (TIGR03435 family)